MPRPKATPKTRATPPAVKKPDLDKLERAVLDALTSAGVYGDDSQVVTLLAHKRLAELGEPTGAMIHVEPVQAVTGDLRAENGTPVADTPKTVSVKCQQARSILEHFRDLPTSLGGPDFRIT